MVLCARLTQWFTPLREQAGAKAGRGCIEHILTLRLITDIAWRRKRKLYVTFVDYRAAYDNVPRQTLFQQLRRLGCGATMLACLIAMYATTNSIIGTAIVTACIGVRQGSPTSCWLFVAFLDSMVKLFKDTCVADGFLEWLHLLVLMDDTVIFATSRERMLHKISLLKRFCDANNMSVNLSKTKFMVINGTDEEKQALVVGDLVIKWCSQYKYLGCIFTADGRASSAVAADATARTCQLMKFISFVDKNNDAPFYVKKKIFTACLSSSLLYGCETWLNADLRPIKRLYNTGLKALLAVRHSTSNDLCRAELGMPDLDAMVRDKQRAFFQKIRPERELLDDDPLNFALRTCLASGTATSRYIREVSADHQSHREGSMQRTKTFVRANPRFSTRFTWYNTVNPQLCTHRIYEDRSGRINELHRIAWTRLRLSAHSLAIEQGRWNRRGRGRLPVEERLCPCGAVQDERHVLQDCPMTHGIRASYGFATVQEYLDKNDTELTTAAFEILNTFPR